MFKDKVTLKDQVANERAKLKWNLNIMGEVYWIQLAENKDQCLSLVNTVKHHAFY
jgi:hypothetical protein